MAPLVNKEQRGSLHKNKLWLNSDYVESWLRVSDGSHNQGDKEEVHGNLTGTICPNSIPLVSIYGINREGNLIKIRCLIKPGLYDVSNK